MKELQDLFNTCINRLLENHETITRLEIEKSQLEAENEQLKQRIAMLEAVHQAESSERECDAYNL